MRPKRSPWPTRAFLAAFFLLTSLCWCPWAYGAIQGRALSIPIWAVLAYAFAAALFVLEWVFLFASGLAVGDDDMPRILSDLESVDTANEPAAKEGS